MTGQADPFHDPAPTLNYRATLVKAKVNVAEIAHRFGFDYSRDHARLPCPACHEQSTTRETVGLYEDASRWHCFRCGLGGDVIDWLAARLETNKRGAIDRLCHLLCIGSDDATLIGYLKGELERGGFDLAGHGKVLSQLRELRKIRARVLAEMHPSNAGPVVAFFQRAAVAAHHEQGDEAIAWATNRNSESGDDQYDWSKDFGGMVGDTIRKFTAAMSKSYSDQLAKSPAAAIDYLKRRHFTGPTCRAFGVGWCHDRTIPNVESRAQADILYEAGLLLAMPPRPAMGGRLTVPFRDAMGNPVALAGRTMESFSPKWRNTRDSGIFAKRCFLFGFDVALPKIIRDRRVVIVEGYGDAMALNQADLPGVATAGTTLTPEHVDSLRGLASDAVLMFDPDEAGRTATANAALALRGAIPSIRQASPSNGFDPDELDPNVLHALVRWATPVAPAETAEEWAAYATRRLARSNPW